jgi:hypothetical protein
MFSDNSKPPPLIITFLLAILAGTMIGIFYVGTEWNWNDFLSGISAGIAFMVTYTFLTRILRLSTQEWRLYALTSISGAVGGVIWWVVAKTQASIVTSSLIGAIIAPTVTYFEAGRNRNKSG